MRLSLTCEQLHKKDARIPHLTGFVYLNNRMIMIKWFKRNQDTPEIEQIIEASPTEEAGFFSRFKRGLAKTRHQLGDGVGRLLLGKKVIDAALLEELETLLISADVGIETTKEILKQLTDELARHQLADGDALFVALKTRLLGILDAVAKPLAPVTETNTPFVILMVGVNAKPSLFIPRTNFFHSIDPGCVNAISQSVNVHSGQSFVRLNKIKII